MQVQTYFISTLVLQIWSPCFVLPLSGEDLQTAKAALQETNYFKKHSAMFPTA